MLATLQRWIRQWATSHFHWEILAESQLENSGLRRRKKKKRLHAALICGASRSFLFQNIDRVHQCARAMKIHTVETNRTELKHIEAYCADASQRYPPDDVELVRISQSIQTNETGGDER
jgi:hypothetical protein